MILFDLSRIQDLHDGHSSESLEHGVGLALMPGRQVKYDHKRHARVVWHVLKEARQRLNPAGRCPDADDRKLQRRHDRTSHVGRIN
ncbi:hypothetical protein AWB82_07256 [Caballeronia glebae]|uniref:Uncharacterized protein n=1 Tax=Caballeronia glebae TaxID=1777143 RepID=A0A158DZ19_9BURK|nr:hypothetical protein AWB82_07256 [Caballeronia glebae]